MNDAPPRRCEVEEEVLMNAATTHDSALQVRKPDIAPEAGAFVWSKTAEFAIAYNGYSAIIPAVEYYLNNVMREVSAKVAASDPAFRDELVTFIKQEAMHSRLHEVFNKRLAAMQIAGLQELIDEMKTHLAMLLRTRPLAFNAAYCAGFESIATYAALYLYTQCDEYFDGADAHGANLLLWHVAEEFEHRSVCHDAFDHVSGSYVARLHGLVYALLHVWHGLRRGEVLVLKHYTRDMPEAERKAAIRRSNRLLRRKALFLAPKLLKVFLPRYHPSQTPMPERITRALGIFAQPGPIRRRVDYLGALQH